jgi:hypothetical protein
MDQEDFMRLPNMRIREIFFLIGVMGLTAACGSTAPIDNKATLRASLTETAGGIAAPPETGGGTAAQAEATAYLSVPQDNTLDASCRITINFFFSYHQGDSLEAYRGLFVSASRDLADSRKPPTDAWTLLELSPASQWWQRNHPATPMPKTLLPDEPNEYFYFVKFTGHYEAGTTPAYWFPDTLIFTMITEGSDTCKIKAYGKG